MLLNIILIPYCLISYFEARKFSSIFVLAILKTNPFSHHLYKCNFIQNLDFALKRLELIFLKSPHVIFIMYITRSDTFIEIDSLQDKISR